jgi:ABC-type transport system substrate-binding protein
MRRQAVSPSPGERRALFAEVQRIFGEELPAIYFVAPRVTIAVSPRVGNATPVQQVPQLLWNAATLSARPQ